MAKKCQSILSPCEYRDTAKHIDDSHVRISVINSCRYVFVLFNEKCADEFRELKVLLFAGISVFAS